MRMFRTKKSLLVLAVSSTLLGLASCGENAASSDIVVSFYPLEYLATRIAGDKLSVSSIIPRGSEPHDFELKTSDVMALHDAQAIFLNGLHMETFQDSVLANDDLKGKTYVVSDDLENLIEVNSSSRGTYIDPHIWLDPILYADIGANMLEKIVALSKENEAYFRANYATLRADLEGLVTYGESKDIANKTIAVSHDAFRYMCRRFGFSELYINGFSPDDEPTSAALSALLDAIEEKGIDTIFFEELENQDIANYIAEQTGAKVEVLSPLETVDEDANYLSVYRSNIDKIAEAKSK